MARYEVSQKLGTARGAKYTAKSTPRPSATASAGTATTTSEVVTTVALCVRECLGTDVSSDAPLMSSGLDSIAAVELARLLSERLAVDVPQTLLFDHPSLDSLSSFFAEAGSTREGSESDDVGSSLEPTTVATMPTVAPLVTAVSFAAVKFELPGGLGNGNGSELRHLVVNKLGAASGIPAARWSDTVSSTASSAGYGSFVSSVFSFDAAAFGVSNMEARSMDPQQ